MTRCANCETVKGPFVAVQGFPGLRTCRPTYRLSESIETEQDPDGEPVEVKVGRYVGSLIDCANRRRALDRSRYPGLR
jgi:hypothetical protein